MYAVVDDRNQQFRAEPGQRIQIALDDSLEPGAEITFDKICLVTGDQARIGAPYVDGVSVTATVIGTVKGPKLVIQKIRRRKNYRRRTGFRARYTEIEIGQIVGVDSPPRKSARVKELVPAKESVPAQEPEEGGSE